MRDPQVKARVVLVVEDNPIARKLVRLTLGAEGFTVIEACDGAEALALTSKARPDLILQDLLLPDIDGFELVTRLRAQGELAAVPIIAFSGFLSRLEYGRAAAMGFTDFLPKPVEPSRLVEVVRAHLPPDLSARPGIGVGHRVLVVDDDPVQLKLARLLLAERGLEIGTATDGADALEVLKRDGADVVVSDILMPRLDGFSLCLAIRKDPRFSQLPVILVSSSYVEDADRELARSMGATAFVVRTPDLAGVIQALDAAMSAPLAAPLASVHAEPTEHHERVLRQLERQAGINASLAQRSAMHASMLSVVADVSEALTRRQSVEGMLPDILASLLEASGVSRGALFVSRTVEEATSEDLVLRVQMGFSTAVSEDLGAFFGHREIFARAIAAESPLVVGSAAESADGRDLLARAGVKSALLVPFAADHECLGIFLLASGARDLTEADWIPFARTMAVQIGQALSLTRAFSKLAASESRYRLLFEGASDSIFTFDKSGRCRDLNPAMERFLGRPRAEVIGAHFSAVVAPDDHAPSTRAFEHLLEKGTVRVEARRFTRPDGSVVLGDISASAVDVDGGVVLGILRDVTERTRAEVELRMLQSLMLAVSETPNLLSAFQVLLQKICETQTWTAGAAWVPRSDAGVLECVCLWTRDDAARTRFKPLGDPVFAAGEGLLGRAWASKEPLWVRDLAAEARCSRSAAAAQLGVHAALAVPVISEDSVVAVIEFFQDRVGDEDERSVGLISAASAQLASIIARKSAEGALHASEARFARLAECGIIGIVIADVVGNILEANDAYLRMVGYSRAELVGGAVRWSDLTPPEFKDLAVAAVGQLQENGVARAWETETFRKDRSRVPMLVGVAMLEYPICIAFTADLTERKRAELALAKTESHLRQAQKMEAVSRLAGGVAHDFNNVLSVILSYGELILTDLKTGDPMRDDVEEIRKAGMRAANLTRQLLMFSRQQVIEPKVLDLNEVLAGMDKMLQRILGEDVDLVSLSNPSLGRVRLDPSSIEQVIMNLVVNARDAMPTGGKLTIETGNVVLDEDYAREHAGVKSGPHVMLAVNDTGVGMDRATQARIFEPFFTTKDKDKGTGLGLATVYGIVQQSGGSVSVYSEPGRGTSFKVYLPRVDAALDAARADEALVDLRGTETILLVEDEDQVRAVASSILRRHGYRVLEAPHAGAALLLCEAHSDTIHLLLTDVVMPQMSGPELAKRLAKLRPKMKVLCMSGYTDDSIVRHGVLQAEVAYLQKPITPGSLNRKVREVLDAPTAVPTTTGARGHGS